MPAEVLIDSDGIANGKYKLLRYSRNVRLENGQTSSADAFFMRLFQIAPDSETTLDACVVFGGAGTTVVNRSTTPPEPWPPAALKIMGDAGARPGKIHPDAAQACKIAPP
jgi:hypothetical protein